MKSLPVVYSGFQKMVTAEEWKETAGAVVPGEDGREQGLLPSALLTWGLALSLWCYLYHMC